MKKLVSILLVAVMMLAMTTTVFAVSGTYSITVSVSVSEKGTVTADAGSSATSGTKVTLTVTPESGYTLGTVSVLTESGDRVSLTTETAGSSYTFTMPEGNVTVYASFSPYTITINNEETGHTYEAYQIFSGTLSGSGITADPYVLTDIEWGSGVNTTKTISSTDESLTEAGVDTSKLTDTTATLMQALVALKVNDSYPFENCTSAADVANVLGSDSNNQMDSNVAKAFADLVSLYLSDTKATSTQGTDCYTISVAAGYYLIKDEDSSLNGEDDAYTRFILQVVADVTASEKSDIPTVLKKVKEEDYSLNDGYGTGYNDVADYDIGDDVLFELIGTMPSNLSDYTTYTYIFHDTMDAGLTFDNNSVVVKIDVNGTGNGDESNFVTIPATYGTTTNYTVIAPSYHEVSVADATAFAEGTYYTYNGTEYTKASSYDGTVTYYEMHTFDVKFDDVLSLVDSSGTKVAVNNASKIYVYFNAKLNENAVIGLPGNENEVYLEYSNNPNVGGSGDTGETEIDKVIVFTYELDVTKTDDDTDDPTALAGAKFKLYKLVGTTKTYVILDSNNKVSSWTTDSDQATELVSDANGKFVVIGLDDGTYYLEETEAPTGYNKRTTDITLTITATTVNNQSWAGTDPSAALTALKIEVEGTEKSGSTSTGVVAATITNTAASGLPVTGGMGTTILYIIGAILVIGAGVLLVTRRRLSR